MDVSVVKYSNWHKMFKMKGRTFIYHPIESKLPQLERIRDPDIVNSKHISPMKDVREEVPNLQVYDCDVCGEKFDTEDNLDAHNT